MPVKLVVLILALIALTDASIRLRRAGDRLWLTGIAMILVGAAMLAGDFWPRSIGGDLLEVALLVEAVALNYRAHRPTSSAT